MLKFLEKAYHYIFGEHAICDDTPDSRKPRTQPVLTGFEQDSGVEMLQKG